MAKHTRRRRPVERNPPGPPDGGAIATPDIGAVTDGPDPELIDHTGAEPADAAVAPAPDDEHHDEHHDDEHYDDEDAHPRRWPAVQAALVPRVPRLVVTITAGSLLFASFPTTNWWWAAIVAFALLSWVLTRPATTLVGGAGYGFLFGLTFYLPLLPWISLLVGAVPWLALATVSALFPPSIRPVRRRGATRCPAGRCGSRCCGRRRSG